MKNYLNRAGRFSFSIKDCIFLLLMICTVKVNAQQVLVLPSNAASSQQGSPQGSIRQQRAFYLIPPADMQSSGIQSGTILNSIGFTLGAPQSFNTKGAFKVYLQNTPDRNSRRDDAWSDTTVNTNSLSLSMLGEGQYEWRVQARCGASNSIFSDTALFSTNSEETCKAPTSLSTSNITTTGARFNWTAPTSSTLQRYFILYKSISSFTWSDTIFVNAPAGSYTISGLMPETTYEWRIKSNCTDTSSSGAGTVFTTLHVVSPQCIAISNPSVFFVNNDSVHLKWLGDITALNQQVEYRIKGRDNWFGIFSISDSVKIGGLNNATDYQWRVKTVCADGASNYVNGPDFKTTGSPNTCYAPLNLRANSVTNNSATLNWDAVEYSTEYIVSYRLKESISWTSALAGMDNVHNDSLNIPVTTGRYTIPFVNGATTDFTYSGQGIYVAWEYSRDTGSIPLPNITMGTDLIDSTGLVAPVFVSFVAKDTSLTVPSLLTSTKLRPETTFGSAQLNDSVAVAAVFALGKTAPSYSKDTIKVIINNFKNSAKDYQVNLTVKNAAGIQRYTADSIVNIAANGSAEVLFKGWVPTILETDSIIVSVPGEPGENVFNNNRKHYIQQVTSNKVSYADETQAFSSAGYGTQDGLILTKQFMTGCGSINAANVYLDASAAGKQVYAVVLNSSGAIISQSDPYTVTDDASNNYYPFYFSTPAALQNEGYYIGLAQTQSTDSYQPVGVQWEADSIRYGAYYRAKLDATDLVEVRIPGRLMIGASLAAGNSFVNIEGKLSLCSGATNTLRAVKADARFANKVLAKSGELSSLQFGAIQALGAPDVYPQSDFNANSWIAANAGDARKYLTLQFPNPAAINFIDIYETLNPGSIDTIYVKDPGTGLYVNVFDTTASFTNTMANKMRIKFPLTGFAVDEVRIALSFDPDRSYNAIDAVAIGQLTNPGGFTAYLWSPGAETTDNISVSAPGVYKVTVTSAGACPSTDSVTVYEPSQVPPVISVIGSLSFCDGDSVTLVSNQSSGNTWSTGATTKQIVVYTAGSYTVSHDDGSGCGITTSGPATVIVNTPTAVSITGNLDICPGNSTVLDAGSGFNSYLWNTGETTRTITVSTASTFSVTVINTTGCSSTASTTTSYVTLAAPVITGTLGFCPGGSTVLDAGTGTGPGYSSYLWSTGASTQTITVNTPGTYDVTVTNAGGCIANASVNAFQFTPPTPSISGIPGFCAGASTVLTANTGYAAYLWSNGSIAPSITVNTAGTYKVTVTDNNGCTGSRSITVAEFLNPPPVISGTLSFCAGTSTTLNAGTGYSSYQWSTGATTQTIVVSAVATYSVTVVNLNGCSASSSVTTTNTGSLPTTPGPISGAAISSCNSTTTYSINPVANTSHYVWMMPAGASILSGQGTTSISVNFGAGFQGGNITVAASNACGQSPSIIPRQLFVQSLANRPGAITGQSSGLCGPTSKTYSIAPVSMATSYTWSVPAGASITSGQGSVSVTVSFGTGFSFGDICVVANNACGSTAPSCKLLSGVSPTPGAIRGPTAVCKNQDILLYEIDPVAGATSYTWTVPQSANVSYGQGSTNIVVRMGTSSGDITVRANSACGSSALRYLPVTISNCFAAPIVYTMPELRPVPEVVSSYGGSGNTGGYYFEWTMGEPRVESVLKTSLLYTQGFHQPLVYVFKDKQTDTTILLTAEEIKVTVFPNPFSTILKVNLETTNGRALVLELTDVYSRLLQLKKVPSGANKNQVDFRMSNYIGGSYFLTVRESNGKLIKTVKLVKVN